MHVLLQFISLGWWVFCLFFFTFLFQIFLLFFYFHRQSLFVFHSSIVLCICNMWCVLVLTVVCVCLHWHLLHQPHQLQLTLLSHQNQNRRKMNKINSVIYNTSHSRSRLLNTFDLCLVVMLCYMSVVKDVPTIKMNKKSFLCSKQVEIIYQERLSGGSRETHARKNENIQSGRRDIACLLLL